MTKCLDSIYYILEKLCEIFLAVATVLLVISVIGRQIGTSLKFTEELSLYLYVWMVLLGAAVVMRNNAHAAITAIPDHLPKKIQPIYQSILYLSMIIFSGVLFYQGMKLTALVYPRNATTLNISMSFAYAAIPVGAFFMLIFCFENLYKSVISAKKTGS